MINMHILSIKHKILFIASAFLLLLIISSLFVYHSLFAAPQKQADLEQFTISLGSEVSDLTELAALLKDKKLIKSERGFKIAYFKELKESIFTTTCVDCFSPGGYQLSQNMTAWEIATVIKKGPYAKWVLIPEGLRKEEIGNRLAAALGWDTKTLHDWTYTYTAMDYDHLEGVYFPDTYLIPINESALDVANRLRRRFDEQFAPYVTAFMKQNVKWTTALKIASLVQREAGSKNDMPLISGIIWNRLLQDPPMKLEIDATIQYARDDRDKLTEGFWKPITPADKEIDSQYNTYKYAGLPPFPISNPGLDAIDAVLNPTATDCLYYLHDSNRQIHCAETYAQHQQNIKTYLQ